MDRSDRHPAGHLDGPAAMTGGCQGGDCRSFCFAAATNRAYGATPHGEPAAAAWALSAAKQAVADVTVMSLHLAADLDRCRALRPGGRHAREPVAHVHKFMARVIPCSAAPSALFVSAGR